MKVYLVLLLFSFSLFAVQKGESFNIDLHDGTVKIVSPAKETNTVGFIITNHTLSDLRGKISTEDKDLNFFSIKSQKTRTFDLKPRKGQRIYFVPLSPPGQEIELVASRKAYEIPPKN